MLDWVGVVLDWVDVALEGAATGAIALEGVEDVSALDAELARVMLK